MRLKGSNSNPAPNHHDKTLSIPIGMKQEQHTIHRTIDDGKHFVLPVLLNQHERKQMNKFL